MLQAALESALTAGQPYFTNLWDEYTGALDNPDEVAAGRRVLIALAHKQPLPSTAEVPTGNAIRRMERYHLIEQDEAGAYRFEVPFGMMFQDFALFPHRTVAENVTFGLKMQGVPKREQQMRVAEMLELVGLEGYNKRSIFELSGGEQQRVALARSLAPRPPLLMLDEPLGSLARTLPERLMDELRSILKTIGMTSLYVTDDQQEAFAISDRLVLINNGQKVQEGTPEELYRQNCKHNNTQRARCGKPSPPLAPYTLSPTPLPRPRRCSFAQKRPNWRQRR